MPWIRSRTGSSDKLKVGNTSLQPSKHRHFIILAAMTQLRSVRNVPTLRVLTLLFPNTSVSCHFALPTRPIRHSTAEVTGKVETTHTRIGIKPSRISPRVHELVNHALACGMNSSASLLGGDLRAHYASHKHPVSLKHTLSLPVKPCP